MKYLVIGGVAAGASAVARLRRLDETGEIVLLERGKTISYANCGLPYHVGGVISDRERLLVMPATKFASWFNVDIRTESEAVRIDRERKVVRVRDASGEYDESYDTLLLATGAEPSGDNFQAGDYPHVMNLWTLSDMDRVVAGVSSSQRVVVVGGGFIGLELAENLVELGKSVTIIQRGRHVLSTFDTEMAGSLAEELASMGIEIRFGCTVKSYQERENGLDIELDCGDNLSADMAVVCTGVRPNSKLAQDAGLSCGPKGHILVNERLETSDPSIYAAGDVIEVVDPIFGGKTAIPLAGPANKQGRIAANNMAGGSSVYKGTYGASIVKVGRLTAGSVGWTEKRLQELGKSYRKIYLHPSSSASYYPGASRLSIKLMFGDDGTIYGCQMVGAKGVDKRIDTIAQAMRNGLKAQDLSELELSYAPPYSSAKDPVNYAGFIAENVLSGLSDVVYPDTIPSDALVVDVREPGEHELGGIPGAVNIRLGELRGRLSELDKSRTIVVHCQVGLRGYLAERILKQHGFKAMNLSGGWVTWQMFHPKPLVTAKLMPKAEAGDGGSSKSSAAGVSSGVTSAQSSSVSSGVVLDVRSLPCPGPVMKLKAQFEQTAVGQSFHVLAPLTFEGDLMRWAENNGCILRGFERKAEWLEVDVQRGEPVEALQGSSGGSVVSGHSVSMVLFSNDLDKALAALILANGLAASGAKVGIFFTFWGLSVLRKNPAPTVKKDLISRMFGWMLPKGARKLALSKMNMMGLGTAMMKKVMAEKSVLTLPELLTSAREAGVKFIACDMAMDVMGITREELIEVDEVAGVASFADMAKTSNNTLFI